MERTGVIGLGRMGSAIAQRMTAEGHLVLGWTRSGRTVEGVESVGDIETLVARCDTLITSLFDDDAVADVLDALLALDLNGKQIIETSTVTPNPLLDRIERIADKGATAVDAPISGGPAMVLAGKCGIFLGGEEASAERARDSLSAISGRILHVGPLGAGLAMKLINNSMIQSYFAGLNDMMPFAKRAGLPLETALRILCGGPAGMPLIAGLIDKVMGEDKEVAFASNAAFKDNDVFQRVFQSFEMDSPILTNFGQMKRAVVEADLLEHDVAAMIKLAYDRGGDP